MKKIILICIWVANVIVSSAANPVKFKSGDLSIFQGDAVAHVIIDDHNTMIDGKDMTAEAYYGAKGGKEYENFIDGVDRAHKSFTTYFNEKKGKIKLLMSDSTDHADYTLKIVVVSMNVGNGGGMAWGVSRKAGGVLINGNMAFVENKTGKVVCEFEFSGVKGLLAPIFKARAISAYRYLADGLIKAVK